jgi:hypothetical protein
MAKDRDRTLLLLAVLGGLGYFIVRELQTRGTTSTGTTTSAGGTSSGATTSGARTTTTTDTTHGATVAVTSTVTHAAPLPISPVQYGAAANPTIAAPAPVQNQNFTVPNPGVQSGPYVPPIVVVPQNTPLPSSPDYGAPINYGPAPYAGGSIEQYVPVPTTRQQVSPDAYAPAPYSDTSADFSGGFGAN